MSQTYKGHNNSRPPRPPPPEDRYLTDAKKFMHLYYDTLDNKRDKIVHLYGSACRLIFDGNTYVGGNDINAFWQNQFPLPSIHTIRNQDYKNQGDSILILMISGEVLCNKICRIFSQVLVCQREDKKWKIMSDNYRLID
uniref:NTF2-related export protein n=1 Tax=Panagrolaimus sp. PS1159 TaxID=55785 RepID=A0AC35FW47_9BILA